MMSNDFNPFNIPDGEAAVGGYIVPRSLDVDWILQYAHAMGYHVTDRRDRQPAVNDEREAVERGDNDEG